jgi:endonuclease/exonuclease/phosphatase family metal-dependent hydrolase
MNPAMLLGLARLARPLIAAGVMALTFALVAAFMLIGGMASEQASEDAQGGPGCVGSGSSLVQFAAVTGDQTAPIGGFSFDPEQLQNAATIIAVGKQLQVPAYGWVIALATARQESGLHNLDHGDRDSLGLFQQRPGTGWGTPAEILDPVRASLAFYGRADHTRNTGLLDIPGWQNMPVTIAAQSVQRSGFPFAYADDASAARALVEKLAPGVDAGALSVVPASAGGADCYGVNVAGCPPSGSPAEAGLTPDALRVLRCVNATFGPHSYAGVGERSTNPSSDHPAGRAVDVMIKGWSSGPGIAEGTRIAAWLQQHSRGLGITYLIWRARIWSPERADEGWRPYTHPSGATDPTSLHMDHVHVSVFGNSGLGLQQDQVQAVSASATAATGPGTITAATFNVLGASHTAGGAQHPGMESGVERVPAMIALLQKYGTGVIGLQEFQSSQYDAFARLAGNAYGMFPGPAASARDRENTIVWRRDTFDLVSSSSIEIPYFNGNRRNMPVVVLKHKATGKTLILINVHNPANTRTYRDQDRYRADALRIERAAIQQLRERYGRPVILTGDLNDRVEPFCALTAGGLVTSPAGGSNSDKCSPPPNPGIDWIFGTAGLTWTGYSKDKSPVGTTSDHPYVTASADLG